MDGKKFWILLTVILVGFVGFAMFSKQKSSDGSGSTASTQSSSNYYGKKDSPVTVTEFVDFQCEACYAYYPAVKEVKEKYKDKVRFQVRNFPITSGHKFAFQAARAAEAAARQGKFWEMHDKLFEGQKSWEQTNDPSIYFESYAKDIGLDMDKFKADRNSASVADVINKDLADVKDLGGTGTPTFAINGKKIDKTAPTVEALSQIIDDALANNGGGNE